MNTLTGIRAALLAWFLADFSILVAGIQASPCNSALYSPRPYKINVSSSLVEETRLKVSSFRPSQDIDEPAWTDGPPTSEISAIAKYWTEKYSWSDVQAGINAKFSHYMTTVPPAEAYNRSLDIHFIHQRSARADAIPMLMLHGWPSTSLEWQVAQSTIHTYEACSIILYMMEDEADTYPSLEQGESDTRLSESS